MQVILDADEAWSLMMLFSSQVIDGAGLTKETKDAIRRWRSDHQVGTKEMDEIVVAVNETLGTVIDEKTTRLLRKGHVYISSKDELRR